MWKALGLCVALAAGFAIFYLEAVTPRPAPADAPASQFSAGRAMADIRAIGAVPHAVGSAANDAVRDYLMARMERLGLDPRIERAPSFAVYGADVSGATVENLIGVLHGRNRSAPALVLMAHHDSVPGSPGAADDSVGVASALEIVRAIEAKGVPARDVMVVITDGEEPGLLGARAFFDGDPLAAHVGYILNMETRGGGGRAAMFETAPDNGGDIALYRRTAEAPLSNALTVFVYRHMPNSTDFTVALKHGKVGLNYAFIGRQFDYHSPSSTPAALDQGALQHLGAQVLPTAQALAFGPLPARAPDAVYGNVIGDVVAAYSAPIGWLVLAAAAALILVGAIRARRQDAISGVEIARGAAVSAYILALCGALLELVRRATGVGAGWTEYRPILVRFPVFELMMLAAALGGVLVSAALAARGRSRGVAAGFALIAGLVACLLGGGDWTGLVLGGVGAVVAVLAFGAPIRTAGAWTGLLCVALVVGVVIQFSAPTAAAAVAWPLLAGALACAVSAAGADRSPAALAATVVIAALTLAWLGGLFHQLLQGLDLPLLAAFPAWLAALVLWPLASPAAPARAPLRASTPLWAAMAVLLIGFGLAAFLRFTNPWTPRHPNAVEPVYIVDPGLGRAWRASGLPPDTWTERVLMADGGSVARLLLPLTDKPLWAAIARVVPAAPPQVTAQAGADRTLSIAVAPDPGAAAQWLAIRSPTTIVGMTVDGRPAGPPVKAGAWARLRWSGPDGFTVALRTADPRHVEIVTGAWFDRWLAVTPLPPVPATDQLWDLAGDSLVIGRTSRSGG